MIHYIHDLRPLYIGRTDDGGVQIVEIDCTAWRKMHPQLTDYRMEITSPDGIVYLPEVIMQGNMLIWPVTKGDTATPGKGMYQIVAEGADGEKKTSNHLELFVLPTMPGVTGEQPPEPSQSWVDKVLDAAKRAEEAAKRAENAAGQGGGGTGGTAIIGIVELLADRWEGSGNLYSQIVAVEGATENSQVDLTPSVEQLVVFYEKDLTFVTENEGGVVTVYAIGQKPANDYTIQVTITEVGT